MFAVICRKRPTWVPLKESILPKLAVFVKSFSSPSVCRNDSENSFTFSYLVNSCGLSSQDALSVSKKVGIKSPQNPDAVLELLREYEFTNSNIVELVNRWPRVLNAHPKKTLLPKMQFFGSIGVPFPILADKLSFNPIILQYSLKNNIIPWYNTLKSVVQSDKRVVNVLLQATKAFSSIPTNIAILRERGIPESSIASLLSRTPNVMRNGKIAEWVDQVAEMGFDKKKLEFVSAIEVFTTMSESTLKRKMDTYRKCGWSESDIGAAFSKFPLCMNLSENKIMANMGFLVNEMGVEPAAIAQCPLLLNFSLEKRIKPRCLVVGILNAKGLLKRNMSITTLLIISEEKFLKKCIVDYIDDIPQLLDIYQGKLKSDSVQM